MTSSANDQRPTETEVAILQILWRNGESTVRQVHEELSKERATGYTNALKLLQIMHGKGLVTRKASGRGHVYRPGQAQEHAQRRLLGDFLDRVFAGSAPKLVMQALSDRKASPEELSQIRELLDKLQTEQDKEG